jgi:DNA-binding response OmpR family regulator
VTEILLATDAPWVVDEVTAALSDTDTTVHVVSVGSEVITSTRNLTPDVVITDMQIGTMGGIAVCMEIRHDEGIGRLEHTPVLVLLDRRPDVFLVRRAAADGWLLKPINALRLRQAVRALLKGERFEDPTDEPVNVSAPT